VAEHAPVDEVLVWSAPWVGRPSEGAESATTLLRRAGVLRRTPPDLTLDLQGDVRANVLLWLTGARHRVGYANTGGGGLLTRVVPLDETLPWPEQNQLAVATALGRDEPSGRGAPAWPASLRDAGRAEAEQLLAELDLVGRRPLVGIHPSGGRAIKQWPLARWAEVAQRLHREHGATILVTGSAVDRSLAAELIRALPESARDVSGRLDVNGALALLARLDLFLSPDTGPMHMACAVGVPSVAVFGPSDPGRYFSGGDPAATGARHLVVAPELWCAPCNLIRRPPRECADAEVPACLDQVTPDAVYAAAARLLGRPGR
jgi:ADP-heptose:LPS heptosyltransferase